MIEVKQDGTKKGSGITVDFVNGFLVTNDGHTTTVNNGAALTETITADGQTLSSYGSSVLDSTSNKVDSTLGSGTYIGQIKTIVMTNASNSSTVSITNHQSSDPEVATFNATDETGVFLWSGTEWVTIFATCTFV